MALGNIAPIKRCHLVRMGVLQHKSMRRKIYDGDVLPCARHTDDAFHEVPWHVCSIWRRFVAVSEVLWIASANGCASGSEYPAPAGRSQERLEPHWKHCYTLFPSRFFLLADIKLSRLDLFKNVVFKFFAENNAVLYSITKRC